MRSLQEADSLMGICMYHNISIEILQTKPVATLISQISCIRLVVCKYYAALGSSVRFINTLVC